MNCVLYARVSTNKQTSKELSIPAQLAAMPQYAKSDSLPAQIAVPGKKTPLPVAITTRYGWLYGPHRARHRDIPPYLGRDLSRNALNSPGTPACRRAPRALFPPCQTAPVGTAKRQTLICQTT